MPRKRKTQSGADALPVQSVPGRRYGEGVESAALQSALPTPDARTDVGSPSVAPPSPQGPPVSAPPLDPATRHAMALEAAARTSNPALLRQPTQMPDQPVTAGLVQGEGPGPEVLSVASPNPAGQWFRDLSRRTGDPYFAQLAERAGI